MSVPVIFIIFRRPDRTRRVFEAIREARPDKLFVVADGPSKNRPAEEQRCREARAIVEEVDWDCEVHRNYAERNLGCGHRPASGISWAFEHVDRAIILEDDCLPDPSFFPFCEEMLNHYADVPQIMHINGNTYGLDQRSWNEYSYGFGNYPQAWGWATWRRAWESFEFKIPTWPAFRDSGILNSLDGGGDYADARRRKWDQVYDGRDPDVWDYQWHYSVMRKNGLAVAPEVNLVSNIGFGEGATHTTGEDSEKASMPTESVEFPLNHPPHTVPDKRINQVYRKNMLGRGLIERVKRKIIKVFK